MNLSPQERSELSAIRWIGIALIVVAVAAAGLLLLSVGSPFSIWTLESPRAVSSLYIIGPVLVVYAATGIGLIRRAKWGYALLKANLYLLFLAFPIGTVVSYLALSYLRRRSISRHFGYTTSRSGVDEAARDRWLKMTAMVFAGLMAILFVWMMLAF